MGKATVSVGYAEGAFDESVTLSVREISQGSADYARVEGELDALAERRADFDYDQARAFDITFLTADGTAVEPKSPVNVAISLGERLSDNAVSTDLVHLPDEGQAEVVENANVAADGSTATFESDAFSVYVVTAKDATDPGSYTVGTDTYSTLQDAINAVEGSGTVWVVENSTETSAIEIPVGKGISLKTSNGAKLTIKAKVTNRGALEINDGITISPSSGVAIQNGAYKADWSGTDRGTLTIFGGSIISSGGYAIDNSNGRIETISGGTISTGGNANGTINGGTIGTISGNARITYSRSGSYYTRAALRSISKIDSISGGVIESSNTGIYLSGGQSIGSITGGTIKSTASTGAGENQCAGIYLGYASIGTISGETTILGPAAIYMNGNERYAAAISSITGGTFGSDTSSYGIYVDGTGATITTITGSARFTGKTYAINNNGGTIGLESGLTADQGTVLFRNPTGTAANQNLLNGVEPPEGYQMGQTATADGFYYLVSNSTPSVTYHTVKFNLNGGTSAAIADQAVEDGQTATKPTDPTRNDGLTFDGWQLDGADYDFATPVTGDITLTATWSRKVTVRHMLYHNNNTTSVSKTVSVTDDTPHNASWYWNQTAADLGIALSSGQTLGKDAIVEYNGARYQIVAKGPTTTGAQINTTINNHHGVYELAWDGAGFATGGSSPASVTFYYDEKPTVITAEYDFGLDSNPTATWSTKTGSKYGAYLVYNNTKGAAGVTSTMSVPYVGGKVTYNGNVYTLSSIDIVTADGTEQYDMSTNPDRIADRDERFIFHFTQNPEDIRYTITAKYNYSAGGQTGNLVTEADSFTWQNGATITAAEVYKHYDESVTALNKNSRLTKTWPSDDGTSSLTVTYKLAHVYVGGTDILNNLSQPLTISADTEITFDLEVVPIELIVKSKDYGPFTYNGSSQYGFNMASGIRTTGSDGAQYVFKIDDGFIVFNGFGTDVGTYEVTLGGPGMSEDKNPDGTYDIVNGFNITDAKNVVWSNKYFSPRHKPGTLTINPASLTITAKDQVDYVYNGFAQGENNATYTSADDIAAKVTVEGLQGTDTLTSIKLNGQQTEIGEYEGENGIVPSAAQIGANGAGNGNYTITYNPGKLTIKTDQAAYTVKHYKQNVDNDEYTLAETESLEGKFSTEVTPGTKDYAGFTAPAKQTVTIAEDGSTVVEYKYDRKVVKVTFDANYDGAPAPTPETIEKKYEAPLGELPTAVDRGEDFEFIGWFTEKEGGAQVTAATKMPAEDVTYYAHWNEYVYENVRTHE